MFKAMAGVATLAAVLWAGAASAYPYVYVPEAGAGTVTVVDAQTNTILRTLPNVNNARAVAVNSDGTRAYVSNGSDGNVTVIDTTILSNPNQNPVAGQYNGLGNVIALAVGPQGKTLYVADANGDQAVAINMAASTYKGPYAAASSGLAAMAVDPVGRTLALASGTGASATVRLYDLTTGDYTDVSLPAQPESMTFSSDGETLWIATTAGFETYDIASGNLTSTAVSGGVGAIAYSPRANVLYAASLGNQDVYAYPIAGGSPTAIALSAVPAGLALSPDGTRLYAPLAGGLAVIDTSTDTVVTPGVSFGTSPDAVGNFVGPGDIWANNSTVSTSVGQQFSSYVTATDYQSRRLSYDVISQPAQGTLNFTQSTGDYAYTPPSGYSGIQTMVWEATAPGGTGSPTVPSTRPVTTSFLIMPVMSAFSAQQVDAGTTLGPFDFTLQGSMPLKVAVTSSNAKAVDPASAVVSSGCGTTTLSCTLTLSAGSVKGASAIVTVTATDPSGLQAVRTFKVTINGGSSGGGGGGSLPWPILAGLAALCMILRMHRRAHENGRI